MRQHSDTSEKGLESLIVRSLIDQAGYAAGDPRDFDRDHAVDLAKLFAFLGATQPETVEALGISIDGPKRVQFLHRLQGEIAKRGVIDVLRSGLKHGPASVELFYGTPTPGNARAEELFVRQHLQRHATTSLLARTRPSCRLMWHCSSMACRSPRSS